MTVGTTVGNSKAGIPVGGICSCRRRTAVTMAVDLIARYVRTRGDDVCLGTRPVLSTQGTNSVPGDSWAHFNVNNPVHVLGGFVKRVAGCTAEAILDR